MKKLLSVFLLLAFFTNGLFAEQKISEKQIENFIKNGSYIKYIYDDGESYFVEYWLKSDIALVRISREDELEILDNATGKTQYFALKHYIITFEDNNIIIHTIFRKNADE